MTRQIPRLENITYRVILYEESEKNNIGTGDSGRHAFLSEFSIDKCKITFEMYDTLNSAIIHPFSFI